MLNNIEIGLTLVVKKTTDQLTKNTIKPPEFTKVTDFSRFQRQWLPGEMIGQFVPNDAFANASGLVSLLEDFTVNVVHPETDRTHAITVRFDKPVGKTGVVELKPEESTAGLYLPLNSTWNFRSAVYRPEGGPETNLVTYVVEPEGNKFHITNTFPGVPNPDDWTKHAYVVSPATILNLETRRTRLGEELNSLSSNDVGRENKIVEEVNLINATLKEIKQLQKTYDSVHPPSPQPNTDKTLTTPLPTSAPFETSQKVDTDTERIQHQQEIIRQALDTGASIIYTSSLVGFGPMPEFRNVPEREHKLKDRRYQQYPIFGSYVSDAFGGDSLEAQDPKRGNLPFHGGNDLGREEIFETVVISPAIHDVETVIQENIKTGLFRRGTKTVEQKKNEQHPATMADLIITSDQSRAVAISYYASTDGTANESDLGRWITWASRPGNELRMQLFIPEDIALLVSSEIKRDPTFIRKLVCAYVNSKYSDEFQSTTWPTSRPPYDRWSQGNRVNRMVIADKLAQPDLVLKTMDEVRQQTIDFKPVGSIDDGAQYTSVVVPSAKS